MFREMGASRVVSSGRLAAEMYFYSERRKGFPDELALPCRKPGAAYLGRWSVRRSWNTFYPQNLEFLHET